MSLTPSLSPHQTLPAFLITDPDVQRDEEGSEDSIETQQLKKDATLPAKAHGNKPSRGAEIDQELKEEEEAILKKKGAFGPAASN